MISSLGGGLGNQMFQYAAAKALALRLEGELRFDLSYFDSIGPRDTPRRFELRGLGIAEEPASEADIRRCKGSGLLARVSRKVLGRDARVKYRRLLPSSKEYFDSGRLGRCRGIYLSGNWQSEAYFRDRAYEIRGLFSAAGSAALGSAREETLRAIELSESIAVHVRRGDYLSDPRNARFGTCSEAYYERAVGEIVKRRPGARCFVFSEDTDWVARNVSLPADTTMVPPLPGADACSDLILMSRCKHFVIANSTYGWWAAWLGAHPGKIVFAPIPWFKDMTREGEDLVPSTWLRMEM